MLAVLAGITVYVYIILIRTGKISLTGAVNGSLAGLVAIIIPYTVDRHGHRGPGCHGPYVQ